MFRMPTIDALHTPPKALRDFLLVGLPFQNDLHIQESLSRYV
jgi:hypothetical protein